MTPLAYRVLKELTLPVRQRRFDDRAHVLSRLSDCHYFEMSDVSQLAHDLSLSIASSRSYDVRSTFLPAQRTWLEFGQGRSRYAIFLDGIREEDQVRVSMVSKDIDGDYPFHSVDAGSIDLNAVDQPLFGHPFPREQANAFWSVILAKLAIVNTPRVIGRQQHMPHRGLERRLLAAKGISGVFPLNAWTEITLRVSDPDDQSGESSHEAHLTGERALHFCRAHIRVRLGRIEIVRGHWRGDGSLGIRQSRYKVTA